MSMAQTLYKQAGEFLTRARDIQTFIETETGAGRDVPQDKYNEWETLLDKADELSERAQKTEEKETRSRQIERSLNDPVNRLNTPLPGGNSGGEDKDNQRDEQQLRAIRKALRGGIHTLNHEEFALLQPDRGSRRDLSAGDDTSGGYIVAPQKVVNRLLKRIDDETFMRQLATVWPLTDAVSMGVPTLDADPADADWTTEVQPTTPDTNMQFGRRELKPELLSKEIKISRRLVQVAAQNIEQIVADRLGYKFGITLEKACLNGSGAGQPLGVFTPSDDGISTGRDKATGGATLTADDVIEAVYNQKDGYLRNANIILHRIWLKAIRKLKTGDGQYIWQPGLASNRPNTILEIPYKVSEYAPSATGSGSYILIIGDFSYYWIAEVPGLEIQTLMELYARTHQYGYIGRMYVDGMPTIEEAFTRLKVA